jgi:hypothetical protein
VDLSCLQPAGSVADDVSASVFNLVAGLLVMAFAGAALVSPLVRSRYRRSVARLMTFEQVVPRPSSWWTRAGEAAPVSASAAPAPATGAPGLRARATQAEQRITRAALIAWGVFSLFGTALGGVLGQAHGATSWLLFGVAVALLAIGPVLTNLPERWSRKAPVIGVLAATAGAVLLQALDPETDSLGDIALGAAVLGAAYFVMFHRSLSGQVMPLFVALGVCALVFFVPLVLLDAHARNCYDSGIDAAATAVRQQLGETTLVRPMNLPGPILLLAATTFGTLGVWLGFRALGGLIWLDERGWFSELSLASFLTLALVALALVFGATANASAGASPIVAALPLVWLGVTAGAYAWALGPRAAPAAAPQLLILRVFAQSSRQHTLLDRMEQRWRYLGPVHQIGGPDLVALNVDLQECTMFLAGRLHELFLPEAASDEQLRSRLRMGADREGRFRVNEVFCFDTAWRSSVERLMHLSEAIVLDLRGFTRQREGTGYEIGLLAQGGLLPRVIAVRDAATSGSEVEALVREAGADPSRLAWIDEDAGADGLFESLLAVAAIDRGPSDP